MSNIEVSPAVAGALKGALLTVVSALVAYFADTENLTFLSASAALIVSTILSAVESSMKSSADGESGLFGAVSIKK